MDELIKTIADKVGISEDQARQAVDMALEYVSQNLPEPYAGHLDTLLKGDLSSLGDLAGNAGDIAGAVGKLFG